MGHGSSFLGQSSEFQKEADRHAGWDRNRRKIHEKAFRRRSSVSEFGGEQPHDGCCFLPRDSGTERADEDGGRAETHLGGGTRFILPDQGASGGGKFERRFLVRVLHPRSVEYVFWDGFRGIDPWQDPAPPAWKIRVMTGRTKILGRVSRRSPRERAGATRPHRRPELADDPCRRSRIDTHRSSRSPWEIRGWQF
jgi:hypothetical protein